MVQEDQFCSSCGKSLTNIYNEEPHQPEVTDEKALEKFVGHNTNFYFSKWGIDTGDVKKVSPNLAAFFLGLFWVTYRKMYGLLIAIFIIFLAIDLLVYSTGAEYLNYFAGIFLGFILVCFGNYFYYTHAKIKIEKIRRKNPSDLLKEVEKAGGTSYLSFFILLI